MNLKTKICDEGEHEVPKLFWSRRKDRKSACQVCAMKVMAKESAEKPKSPVGAKTTAKQPISKKSKKQIARDALYYPIAKKFKEDNPICQIQMSPECTGRTEDVHHACGKTGDLYFDKRWFVATCRKCHEWAERSVSVAKELGFSHNRLDK